LVLFICIDLGLISKVTERVRWVRKCLSLKNYKVTLITTSTWEVSVRHIASQIDFTRWKAVASDKKEETRQCQLRYSEAIF